MHDRARSTRLFFGLVFLAATSATARGETLITAPSLVNKTPGPDFRVGTADDGDVTGAIAPNGSGANVHGAASFLLLKQDGSIPADGTDFDYILFLNGTVELTPDLAMSTASTLVMDVTGGTVETTPEFTPGRSGGTVTGLTGRITFHLGDGSATERISGRFVDPAFATAIMNQDFTTGPGKSVVVMRPSFGSSGDAYVDGVLTPLLPAGASTLTLTEFQGTANGLVECCSTFGARGVFALYSSDALPGCTTIATCSAALAATLPPTDASDKKVRATARRLRQLAGVARTKLGNAEGATGKKQTRLYKGGRSRLQALLRAAKNADNKGRLGVNLAPIVGAVDALLALIPA